MITPPPGPTLSQSQLATLASRDEQRKAAVGDVLFRVGDARYPFRRYSTKRLSGVLAVRPTADGLDLSAR